MLWCGFNHRCKLFGLVNLVVQSQYYIVIKYVSIFKVLDGKYFHIIEDNDPINILSTVTSVHPNIIQKFDANHVLENGVN